MDEAPQKFADLMWLMTHVGVPAAVGLVIGILVRSLIRSAVVLVVLGLVAITVLSKMGMTDVSTDGVDKATSILPSLADWTAALFRTLRASPPAIIGLALGVVLRERWRHRRAS